ncbi:MAG TPA: SHOCT domain-containing protein [Actinomycetota bacterium]|nr:SHOCT domain-containing protein [Actinomycetota bacterium]
MKARLAALAASSRLRHTDAMDVLGVALQAMTTGFLIGGAARFAVPGPDPMPFWLTVLIGLGGSATGTAIASAIFGTSHTFDSSGHAFVTLILAVGFAAGLVAAYRILIQKRPLTGPEARRFPHRGWGIAKMRARLRRIGVDPDRLSSEGRDSVPPRELSQDEVVEELERLRAQRESGAISAEEYDAARQRLRRY